MHIVYHIHRFDLNHHFVFDKKIYPISMIEFHFFVNDWSGALITKYVSVFHPSFSFLIR